MSVLPSVRRQLLEAVEARSKPGVLPSRHPRGRLAGYLVAVAVVAVPIVIAAGALILVRAHRPSSTSSPSSSVAATAAKAERQELIENFGVFRRRQTSADRDRRLLMFPFVFGGRARGPALGSLGRSWGYPELDESLVRVVAVPESSAKVGLDPATWRPSLFSPLRAEGLDVVMRTGTASTIPPASEVGIGPPPTSVAAVLAHGLAVTDGPRRGGDTLNGVLVVPNGVAMVTIRPIRLGRSPVALSATEYGTVSAAVHDNVAAFHFRSPTLVRRNAVVGTFGFDAVAETTWYDARGRVIKSTTTSLGLFVRVVDQRQPPISRVRGR